ncbi:MAG: DUF3276 family protein [Treponema sp.]|nr:DUF3276 family protein [Treponema sp.]
MGIRGEIFSQKVILPNRTYFFNVKENRLGDLYLNIVESKNRDNGGFDRQSVILFADDLQEFLKGFEESLKVLEKATREKRHSGKTSAKLRENKERSHSYKDTGSSAASGRAQRPRREDKGGERSGRDGKNDRNSNRPMRSNSPEHNRGRERGADRSNRSNRSNRSDNRSEHRSDHNRRPAGNKRVVIKKRD